MAKKFVYVGLIALCSLGFSLGYAIGADLPLKDQVLVEFKMVCAGAGQVDCRRAAILNNYEELFVNNIPFLLTKDIVAAKIKQDSGAIDLQFTKEGSQRFNEITSKNAGRRMAIFIDGSLLAILKIYDPVTTGKITIISSLTKEEAQTLVNRINKNNK